MRSIMIQFACRTLEEAQRLLARVEETQGTYVSTTVIATEQPDVVCGPSSHGGRLMLATERAKVARTLERWMAKQTYNRRETASALGLGYSTVCALLNETYKLHTPSSVLSTLREHMRVRL